MAEVSVVIPVLDEVQSMPTLLASLVDQTLVPDEVIVVDGGSTDGTRELVHDRAGSGDLPFPLRVIELDGARPGRGRNEGTRAAEHDIVACTDAGVVLNPTWLQELVGPLIKDDETGVVIGTFLPDGRTRFERLVGSLIIRPPERVKLLYAGGVSIAYRRSAWGRVSGYREEIYPCEDAAFLRDLDAAGVGITRAHNALSRWRPRQNFPQLWQQYRAYAWGDAMIGLGVHRHLTRAGFYLAGLIGLVGLLGPYGILAGALLFAFYLLVPTAQAWVDERSLPTWLLGPAILLTKDLAQMTGFAEGLWNRLRGGGYDFGRRGKRLAAPVRKNV